MEENISYPETELFSLISRGDEQAFEQIFHKYNKQLFPFIFSMIKSEQDAREIIQEVFLKLWVNRESLTGIQNPGGWLSTVAANTAYDYLRKQASYELRLANFKNTQADKKEDLWETMDIKETQTLIQEAVSQLPFRRRQVFQLSKMEGYSRKEVAEHLQISENTVRNQLAEATEFVKAYLQKNQVMFLPPFLLILLSVK